MKFIITVNKLNNVVFRWMNDSFNPDELEIVKSKKHPESIFFMKDGKFIFYYHKKNGYTGISNNKIWSFLTNIETMQKYSKFLYL